VSGRLGSNPGIRRMPLIPPEILKSLRTQFRIPNRVSDVPMPEVLLDRSRILTLIGELVAGRMPQHVRVDGEGEFGELAGAHDELACRANSRPLISDWLRSLSAERTRIRLRRRRLSTRFIKQKDSSVRASLSCLATAPRSRISRKHVAFCMSRSAAPESDSCWSSPKAMKSLRAVSTSRGLIQ
jgi:hypothetical protein